MRGGIFVVSGFHDLTFVRVRRLERFAAFFIFFAIALVGLLCLILGLLLLGFGYVSLGQILRVGGHCLDS